MPNKNFVFVRHFPKRRYITEDKEFLKVINSLEINEYEKIPRIKVGDYVTCCDLSESIDPKNNITMFSNYSYDFNKTIRVTEIGLSPYVYYTIGEDHPSGILMSGLRPATQEEIDNYEKENTTIKK